jgi:putative hydrolase of the HAD superfamily
VREKREALGLREGFCLEACATDAGINAFKPDPKSFLWSCQRWDLVPAEVLHVGDRGEVDAAGAANAGMPRAILRQKPVRMTRRRGTSQAMR